ncbi:MAG: UDP-N-acetylenolpyruvoylglucosamine reductase [Clostridia bacterium 41_269]|nr:MAG: UDP-N-acetylenolpyruvoylglucosamine reductase [Clostridia bacterium 41_269]
MIFKDFAKKLENVSRGKVLIKEPLFRHNSWKIGGPADVLFIPKTFSDLRKAVMLAGEYNIPVTILGNGTNVLILDGGIEGLVIKLSELKRTIIKGSRITASAGVSLPYLAFLAQKNGLSGLEFAVGIPGTVGGAVFGNAGAHGKSIQDVVSEAAVMDISGRIFRLRREELGLGYRTSAFTDDRIILWASFSLKKENGSVIKETMEYYLRCRKETQPLGEATAGCVFKNPPEGSAGYFIEKAGLKGLREGNARVSLKHANFIVNEGGAKASDVLKLIEKIKEEVFEKFGVELKCEIKILGRGP